MVQTFLSWRADPRIDSILDLAASLGDEGRDQLLFAAEDLFSGSAATPTSEDLLDLKLHFSCLPLGRPHRGPPFPTDPDTLPRLECAFHFALFFGTGRRISTPMAALDAHILSFAPVLPGLELYAPLSVPSRRDRSEDKPTRLPGPTGDSSDTLTGQFHDRDPHRRGRCRVRNRQGRQPAAREDLRHDAARRRTESPAPP